MTQTQTATDVPAPRLKVRYNDELRGRLKDEVNMGVGEAVKEARLLEGAVRDLTQITGQKPLVTKAKKSIAGFKIREGQTIGAGRCCVRSGSRSGRARRTRRPRHGGSRQARTAANRRGRGGSTTRWQR